MGGIVCSKIYRIGKLISVDKSYGVLNVRGRFSISVFFLWCDRVIKGFVVLVSWLNGLRIVNL